MKTATLAALFLSIASLRVESGPPAAISVVSGNNQFGAAIAGPSVPTEPLKVRVVDEYGVAIADVKVAFTFSSPRGDVLVAGGPTIETSTDSQGIATLATFQLIEGEGFFNVLANTSPPLSRPATFILSQHASVGCSLPALRPQTTTSIAASPNPTQTGMFIALRAVARTQPSGADVSSGEIAITDSDRIVVSQRLTSAAPNEVNVSLTLPGGSHVLVARLQETCFYRTSKSEPLVQVINTGLLPVADYSDMWWKASESGWGMSVIQHASGQMFVVWYHYREDGSPQWLVIPGGVWTTATTFTGAMYRTSGPAYNGVFDPSRVAVVPVGVATLSFVDADSGIFTWSMDGVQGLRSITRQPF